jgi:hypothetical protein
MKEVHLQPNLKRLLLMNQITIPIVAVVVEAVAVVAVVEAVAVVVTQIYNVRYALRLVTVP